MSTTNEQVNWIAGLDILGKGYDIFGRYAHPSGVYNANIFRDLTQGENGAPADSYTASISGREYAIPYLVATVEEHTSAERYVSGSSVSEFQSELDIKVKMEGRYKYYSGEAKFGFHQSKQVSQELYYTNFAALMRAYRLALPDNTTLRTLLDPDFASQLNSTDHSAEVIDAFFAKCGTHFLAEVVLGGSNNYYATVEKSSVSSELEVEASVKASYNSFVTSASVAVNTSYTSDESLASTHSETGVETIGGDETKAPLLMTDATAYAEWLDTIAEDPALVDFTEQSLRPVWELCDPAATERRTALENRFLELSGQANVTSTRGYVQHGAAIYPPWGTKEDWNLFVSPAVMGRTENDPALDVDNAILEFDYGIDTQFDYPDHWQIKAKYRYRTTKSKENGKYHIRWYNDGWVNYLLIPKFNYTYLSLGTLDYDAFDPETGTFSLNDTPVYQYDAAAGTITDSADPATVLYEDVAYANELFYQRVPVSVLATDENDAGYATAPDDSDEWNLLLTPRRLSYTENSAEKDTDNSLIRWNWSGVYDYHYTLGEQAPQAKTIGSTFARYRKGHNTHDDTIFNKHVDYAVLWVRKEFSHWTGCYGEQTLQLPPEDQKLDDWELIASPIRMGDVDEDSDEAWKNSSLLMTQCQITKGAANWTVSGTYLWADDEQDSTSVASAGGQSECLFVRTNILREVNVG